MKKLWGGRFSESADSFAEAFGASILFDCRLAPFDIQGSIAHAQMLGETGIITAQESSTIQQGLSKVRAKLERGEIEFRISDEDIHMNIERYLTEEIGSLAGKLHTARSRNDQVALDCHLFVRAQIIEFVSALLFLQESLIGQARANPAAIMPGYTHLQRAQPVLFSHHLLAYAQMFQRDIGRLTDLWKRVNILPLGAGALAGTTFPINRERVAELLGFDELYENSMDAVSDRDFVIEFISCAATCMMHLSRLGEELVLWTTGEFSFVELHDSLSTGSSIMPQKKNPDFAELIRGKTGRVYGALTTILTVMKGLPLAYNKDMQEDKECLFDTVDTVLGSLRVASDMIRTCKINALSMRTSSELGYTNATDAADYLAKKGLPFREAHEVVGKLVRYAITEGKGLEALSLDEYKRLSPMFEADIFEAIALETVVNRRTSRGGTAASAVEQQLKLLENEAARTLEWIAIHTKILG
jgi:argininosuccinate lyase